MQEQTTQVVFLVSQVVFVMMMVVLSVLGTTLSSGVLQSTTIASPGSASWTSSVAVCTGTTTSTASISLSEPPSVASGIDYLTICGRANAGGKKGVWGEFPLMGLF